MKNSNLKILLSFFEITAIFTGVVMVCYLILGQILEVTGESMAPLIQDKERILAEKISPKFSKFNRGEIVVFTSVENGKSLIIKRVIAIPGDNVALNSSHVFVNDQLIKEPYLSTNTETHAAKFLNEATVYKVPENNYFVMGDNRAKSIDSRTWGPVPAENILGRAILIYQPITKMRFLL